MNITLNSDHQDTLKEFLNISMGQAADKLARLLNLHVTLTIPSIRLANEAELEKLSLVEAQYYYTRQSFYGGMTGELITLLSKKGGHTVAKGLQYQDKNELAQEEIFDSLLEISNILSGASLKGVCQQLELNCRVQPPTIFKPSNQPMAIEQWRVFIVMEVAFLIESAEFETKTVICLASEGIDKVIEQLNEWI